MKKLLSLILVIVTIFSLSTLVSCKKKFDGEIKATVSQEQGENGEICPVVITVLTQQNLKDATLIDCMNQLLDKNELSFSVENGMITKINGTKNGTNSYWMLYTNDTENSNTAWGTYEYEQVVFGSAMLGAESLLIKEGCTYIWVYQTF